MNREIYANLSTWKNSDTRKPLILKGARQVGKTHILKEFGKNEFKNCHYLNFEEDKEKLPLIFRDGLDPKKVLSNIEILFDKSIDPLNDLLIFDEIQECPDALTSLKYFSEKKSELALCCAGSYLGLQLNQSSFPVGKVEYLHMFPINFREFVAVSNNKISKYVTEFNEKKPIPALVHDLLWDELKKYFIVGGLPEVVKHYIQKKDNLINAFKKVRDIQKNLITDYMSDFSKHSGKANANHISRVFYNIPNQLGQSIDSSANKFRFKQVIPKLTKYSQMEGTIDWLVKAGLVIKNHIIETPQTPLKSYLKENSFKLFLFDVGILGCIQELPFESLLNQDYGTYKGYFAENFVAQEFVCSGIENLYSWVHRTSEIEFLRIIDGNIIPIEVKSGNRTKAKSFTVYTTKYNPKKQIKISAKPFIKRSNFYNYPLYLAGSF